MHTVGAKMPKITIEIEFMGAPDVEMRRPVGEILKAHSTYLLADYTKDPGPRGKIEFDYYKATLKWNMERGE